MIWKSAKTKNFADVPPCPGTKIFGISPKMRHFGGKRWEKLWIGWNWPFRVNLSLILREKMEKHAKWPKLAILSQSKPLFWQNLPLWVILSHFSVKRFRKVEKLKKFANVHPPGMKTFEISPKMGLFGGKTWEKLWIGWNWPFRVNLSLIYGKKMEKHAKWPKLAVLSQSKWLFCKICHCGSFWVALAWNDLKKFKNYKIIASADQLRSCWDI